jgi:hypothetical protein
MSGGSPELPTLQRRVVLRNDEDEPCSIMKLQRSMESTVFTDNLRQTPYSKLVYVELPVSTEFYVVYIKLWQATTNYGKHPILQCSTSKTKVY